MSSRKYAKDYRLSDTLDERGRIRTETEYVGAIYCFIEGNETARKALCRMLMFTGLGTLCFMVSLLPLSAASLTLYVMLPYLFSALPLALLLAALFRLRRAGVKLDHRTADQANERVPACCLWLLILPGVSLLGEGIALTIGYGTFLPGDALFLAGALGTMLCAWLCFQRKALLRAVAENQ